MRALSEVMLYFILALLFGLVHAEDVIEDIAQLQVEKSPCSVGLPLNCVRQAWDASLPTG